MKKAGDRVPKKKKKKSRKEKKKSRSHNVKAYCSQN